MSLPTSPASDCLQDTKTVLFIEGNLASLDLVEAVLARLPLVHLLPVMQGRRGIGLAGVHQPALILLDLELPDSSGIAVLRSLRADPRTCAIPVITFGAATTAPLTAYVTDIGAQAHLTQPFDIRRLLEHIEIVLARTAHSAPAAPTPGSVSEQ